MLAGGRSLNDAGGKLRPVDWSQTKLSPVKKQLYHEHAAIMRRSQAEIDQYLTQNECNLQGNNIPRPIFEFHESGYPRKINQIYCPISYDVSLIL